MVRWNGRTHAWGVVFFVGLGLTSLGCIESAVDSEDNGGDVPSKAAEEPGSCPSGCGTLQCGVNPCGEDCGGCRVGSECISNLCMCTEDDTLPGASALPATKPVEGCGEIPPVGLCNGHTLVQCINNTVQSTACDSSGEVCGWDQKAFGYEGAFACVEPKGAVCPDTPDTGVCDGNVLSWCDNTTGQTVSWDCGSEDTYCGWTGSFYCCHEQEACVPLCQGKQCGDDGCGGQCGECEGGESCTPNGQCTPSDECDPQDYIGSCEDNILTYCANDCPVEIDCTTLDALCDLNPDTDLYDCLPCTPDCSGKTCGDNGCGGSCGSCPNGKCSDNGTCSDSESTSDPCDGVDNDGDGVTDEDALDCADGNACTQDLCVDGTCQYDAVDCEVGPCLQSSCDPLEGCIKTPMDGPCDDGDTCTQEDTCVNGLCQGSAPLNCDDEDVCTEDSCDSEEGCIHAPTEGPCDDGDACTTGEICISGACVGGDDVSCDDGNPCTEDSCDATEGCSHTNTQDSCDDGNACTPSDHCVDGNCVGTGALNCDDSEPCTDDACDPASGCVHPPNDGPCDDGNACTPTDTCSGGVCSGWGALDCNDENPCTQGTCHPAIGCKHTPHSALCEDGNPCTTGDSCKGGSCQSGSATNCDDGNACTDDSCDPNSGCVHTNNQAQCTDGNPCTAVDECIEGTCVGQGTVSCEDGDPCTDDSCCPEQGCLHTTNQAPCDDANSCTPTDMCQNGACVGSGMITCDDGDECTDDQCDPAHGCTHTPNQSTCDDGNACTTGEQCQGGVCGQGAPVLCNDQNPCTDDACEPDTGCTHKANSGGCSDGNACTSGEQCEGGQCCGGVPVLCDDNDLCTVDSCDPSEGCVHSPATGLDCNDGNACTAVDECMEGTCVGVANLSCDDGNPCTDDPCDAQLGCQHTDNSAPCNDGDVCTTDESCTSGACSGGTPTHCDDGNPCTDDTCASDTGCVHTPNNASCNDGNACTEKEFCQGGVCCGGDAVVCDDGNPCTIDSCDPQEGCVTSPANGTWCTDGNVCTQGDSCQAGSCQAGPLLDCSDGYACTDDHCNPKTGCGHNFNVAPCDDNNPCTLVDTCEMGACVGSGTPECDDNNPCTDDSCEASNGCVHANNSAPCDNGSACTSNDVCSGGSCQPGTAITCNDGNECTKDSCDPQSGCQTTPQSGGACDDGNLCTTGEICDGGICAGGEAVSCDDQNLCTLDSCHPETGCAHSNNDGQTCDDGNICNDAPCSPDVVEHYAVSKAAPAWHGLYLPGFFGGGLVLFNFEDDASFDVLASGNAVLSGTATVTNGPAERIGEQWSVYITYEFRGTGPAGEGTEGPKVEQGQGSDLTNTWRYFDMSTGKMQRIGSTDHALLEQWPANSQYPLQLGVGANGKNMNFGASSWIEYEHVAADCVHTGAKGDINVDLIPKNVPPCASDQCIDGECVGGPSLCVDDGNPCTEETCDNEQGCQHTPLAEGAACSDNNLCTTGDSCIDTQCVGSDLLSCTDDNPCTTDGCDPAEGCVFFDANGTPCNDNNPCTEETACWKGDCAGGNPMNCDDGNPCTQDTCHADCGCLHEELDGPSCDDGNACTTQDTCWDGVCVGGPAPPEVCDSVDNNCNGTTDEGCACTYQVAFVSDEDTQLHPGNHAAVATWSEHPHWEETSMAIPNATWIWNAYLVDEPDEDEKQRFVRSFHLPSNVTVLQAQVRMSADNGFKLKVNNKTIADYKDVETNYFHVFEFDVTSKLKNGKNTFRWDVENFEQPGGTAYSNPAGLIFEITVTYELPVTNGCCPE